MSRIRIALQPASGKIARQNAGATLDKPVGWKYLESLSPSANLQALKSRKIDGSTYLWGVRLEREPEYLKMLRHTCLVLFRQDNFIFKCGLIVDHVVDLELPKKLWKSDEDGQSWPLIYFLRMFEGNRFPARAVNSLIDRQATSHWQSLTLLDFAKSAKILELVKTHYDLCLNAKSSD